MPNPISPGEYAPRSKKKSVPISTHLTWRQFTAISINQGEKYADITPGLAD